MDYQPIRTNPVTYATHGVDFSKQQVGRLYRVRGVPLSVGASEVIRIACDFRTHLNGETGDVSHLFKKVFNKAASNPLTLVNCKRRMLKTLTNLSLDDDKRLFAKGITFSDCDGKARLYIAHKTYITL